jgi:toxin FitB
MYLVDTDVISNARKGTRANPGVRRFFRDAATQGISLFLSAGTVGELRQ